MLPQISIYGRAVADPEVRFTNGGKTVARVRVAANDRTKTDDGTWVDGDSAFLDVEVWGKAAENIAESVRKGDGVIAIGQLKQDTWQDSTGANRTTFRIARAQIGVTIDQGPRRRRNEPQYAAPAEAQQTPPAGEGAWQATPAPTRPPNW